MLDKMKVCFGANRLLQAKHCATVKSIVKLVIPSVSALHTDMSIIFSFERKNL